MAKVAIVFLLLLTGCAAWGFAPAASPTPTPPADVTSSPTTQASSTARISPTAAIQTPTPPACVVANTEGESLNIRKAPSLEAEIIGGLIPGQRVTVITWGSQWHNVSTGQLTGYISSEYCEATR